MRDVGLLMLLCLLMGCASSLKRGDEAFQRRDWDQAVEMYQEALRGGVDAAQEPQTRARLAESQVNSGRAHLERSRQLETGGDIESALVEAGLAYRYNPTTATAQRVGEVKAVLAPRLRQQGVTSLQAGALEAAVQSLARAQELAPTEEGANLLAQASTRLAEVRHARQVECMAAGNRLLTAHQWTQALAQYSAAIEAGATGEANARAGFARSMAAAESAIASKQWNIARMNFEAAARQGIDSEYVQSRMYEVVPFPYVITIHEGVILPFKPDTEMPWDGVGTKRIASATQLLSGLGALSGGQTGVLAAASDLVVGGIQSQIEPPDTYVVVTVGGTTLGSRDLAFQDSLRPTWNLQFSIQSAPADGDSITIAIYDRDLDQDDKVGSIQLTSQELLSAPGLKEYYFVQQGGRLRAGGLLALRLTVERE